MATQTIEGTWEEIAQNATDFVGRKVRLTILDDENSTKPNEAMLKALCKVSKRSEKMPVSADDETLKMIREARSGGMFGNDTPTTNIGFVVVDANILISLCAKEPTQTTAKQALEKYAKDGWSFYAPNLIVAEVLYILCLKHQKNTLTRKSYKEAIKNFQDQMKVIQIIDDRILIKRAAEIQKDYGCSRSADSIYIALAEHLGKSNMVELLTFDNGFINQSAKNASSVTISVLPI